MASCVRHQEMGYPCIPAHVLLLCTFFVASCCRCTKLLLYLLLAFGGDAFRCCMLLDAVVTNGFGTLLPASRVSIPCDHPILLRLERERGEREERERRERKRERKEEEKCCCYLHEA